jgi:hypothetical protein
MQQQLSESLITPLLIVEASLEVEVEQLPPAMILTSGLDSSRRAAQNDLP